MFDIEQKIARKAKRAGLLTGGLLLCAVGCGFLTVAGWLVLVPVVGLPTTAFIIAAVYLGLGLILIGISTSKGGASEAEHLHQPRHEPSEGGPFMQAFIYGVNAGSRANKARG